MLNAKLQYFSLRIEVLINLVACNAKGSKRPTKDTLERWLNEHVGPSSVGMMEDPPEDVHVSNVTTKTGSFKILEGTWEGNDFFLQRILGMVETIPQNKDVEQMLQSIVSLLKMSDSAISAVGLSRYAYEPDQNHQGVKIGSVGILNKNSQAVRFSSSDLSSLGVDLNQLAPFIVDMEDGQSLKESDLLYSPLTEYPLHRAGENIILVMPTAVSAAIRSMCIKYIVSTFGEEAFERNLAHEYLKLFKNISPLGDMGPIDFRPAKNKSNYMGALYKKFDEGRYIGLVFIFDNVSNFVDEGWQSSYASDDNTAEECLGELVGAISSQMRQLDDYTRGYILVISCGYGRAQYLNFSKDKTAGLSFAAMSAFDFVMLSQAKSISTFSVAKLIDQKQFFEDNDYKFVNPNGFLNLYGHWISSGKWLLPEALGFGLSPGVLVMSTNSQLELRLDNRRTLDKHSLYVPHEGYRDVWNKAPRPLFKVSARWTFEVTFLIEAAFFELFA